MCKLTNRDSLGTCKGGLGGLLQKDRRCVIGPTPKEIHRKRPHRRVYAIALEQPTIYLLPHQIYAMPPERIVDEDEEYESSQDSDFAPDADDAPDAASNSSDSEDGDDNKAARKRQRPVKDASAEGEEEPNNSGDEAILEKGRKKQKRAKAKGEAVDDEGGEGGLIKTRSQRAAEYASNSPTMRNRYAGHD